MKYLPSCLIASLILLSLPLLSRTAEEVQNESKRVNEFLDKKFDEYVAKKPQFAAILGLKIGYDKWNDISDEQDYRDLADALMSLHELKTTFNLNALDKQTRLSVELYENQIKDSAEELRYQLHNYPLNQMYGLHTGVPTFLMNIHRIDSEKDARDYIARIKGIPSLFKELIKKLETRAQFGVIPPKFVFPLVIDAARKTILGQPLENSGPNHPLLDDFTKKISQLKLDPKTEQDLVYDLKKSLTLALKPAYESLISYLTKLEKKANTDAGAWKFPNGKAFYESALRATTTTNLSAEEIHNIGLKEVARIHKEMEQIMKAVKFEGDLNAFFKFMRTDEQFYFPNTEEGRAQFLAKSVEFIDNMRNRLDELFITKPKANIEVRAVEKFRENSAGSAFYNAPSPDGSRAGIYYVNLRDLKTEPIYSMEALAYHEGIPGHHMQIAIAQELKGIPKFRKFGGYTAFVEGWALYTELIPKEIGLYQDPYSDFGRLSMELWRAARLVVDTGIHAMRWSREKAIQYLIDNTPNAESDCEDSINRYIVLPSQATAYKVGMIKILELREKAKKEMGKRFDIKQFHDVVLTNGALPLSTLERLVNDWIAQGR